MIVRFTNKEANRAPTRTPLSALVAAAMLWVGTVHAQDQVDASAVRAAADAAPAGEASPTMLADASNTQSQAAPAPKEPEQIRVVGVAAILGTGVNAAKVPNSTRVANADDLARDGQPSLIDALSSQVGSVGLNAVQGNPYQPDFNYRGFTASPVEGTPIGLAVYQNGVRINEGFGDTVNWDLVPSFAIRSLNLSSANPVFGFNALGGAIALSMKDGFNSHGVHVNFSDGSFGRKTETADYGVHKGGWAFFIGGNASDEKGWRVDMPSRVHQFYADVGYRNDDTDEVHLSYAGASNSLAGTGPTPLNLIAQNYGNAIDYPGTINNQLNMFTLSGEHTINDKWSVQAIAYNRQFNQNLANGAPTSSAPCTAPLNPNTFCSANPVTGAQEQLIDQFGQPVPLAVGGAYPGENDVSQIHTDTWGGTLQATSTAELLGHGNHFIAGGTLAHADTDFHSGVLLGALDGTRTVQNTIPVHSNGGSDRSVGLNTTSTYGSFYATDTLDLTKALSITASVGYNRAHIVLHDLIGDSLNGTHDYHRLNPSAGLTYQLNKGLTVFADYSEDNRAPTPAELSCAKATDPCNLASFFLADPDLKQVVAKTMEAGVRGQTGLGAKGNLYWSVSAYRTENYDDITSVASAIPLHGYFQNAGNTRREGVDVTTQYHDDRWRVGFDYSLLYATFQSYLTLSSPYNPYSDANGNIYVHPGDTLPNRPRNSAKLSVDYAATHDWNVGATLDAVSSQVLGGDQSNQTPHVPGYAVFKLRTSYTVNEHVLLWGSIDNATNRKYYTYGTYTTETGLPMPAGIPALAQTRSYGAGAPFGAWMGVKLKF